MSLLRTASTFQFSFFALSLMYVEPSNPCSSPLTATKIIVAGKECLLIILAHSITAAVPLPSSSAPGASLTRSITLVRILSRWPLIIKMRLSFGSVPFNVAITFPSNNNVSTLLLSGCNVVVSIIAESRPLDCFANSLKRFNTHALAAPIPRLVFVCVLNVFRVPKATNVVM